ncbi:MAG TPA: hypothetical protein PLU80_15465, partial [Acidobacteriota bacterium]|nr:hypothetical protein [Acidobacteriota bacterium]
ILENQRSQLKQRLITILEGIYGIGRAVTGSVDMSSDFGLADHFQSLDPGLMLQPPVSARFQDGFLTLLDQALTHQFPGHPQFDNDTKLSPTVLKRVYQEVERAIQHPEGRIEVEKDRRRELRQIMNPLKIGEMTTETHFVLGHHWPSHFLKKEAEHGGPITVARLRRWMDEPQVMGLPSELQDLITLVFASQTNRFFVLRGTTVTPALNSLTTEMELREQQLPDESDWKKARERASKLLNLELAPLRNATNLNKAIEQISKLVQGEKPLIEKLATNLENAVRVLQLDPATVTRLQTAQAARTLINQLSTAKSKSVIETLARFEFTVSEAAITACLHRAEAVNAAFEKIEWSIFDAVNQRSDQGQPAAQALLTGLKEALKTDEHITELATFLKNVFSRAVKLLAEASTSLPTQPLVSLPSTSSTASPGTSSLVTDRSSPPTTQMLGSGGYSTRLGTPVPLSTTPLVAPRPLSVSGSGTQSIQEQVVSNETELQPVLQELRSWVS